MKTAWRFRCEATLVSVMLLALMSTAALAQYTIDWFTIDGGGGTSTGGVYSISATIGQPDAGVLTGGNYTLVGGFWGAVAAIQSPGAPWLNVLRTVTNTVVVYWSAPAEGWRLETATEVNTASEWTKIPPPYQTVSTNLAFVEPIPLGNKFYRLQKR